MGETHSFCFMGETHSFCFMGETERLELLKLYATVCGQPMEQATGKGDFQSVPKSKAAGNEGCADLHRHSGLRRPIGADAFEIRELKVKTGFSVANTELARVTRNNHRLPLFVQQSLAGNQETGRP